ncbi:DUF2125 domain-containing protein [uncultured Cohaesibacter sp.]|uniref:DUF2125 domain-containing protein n=1 Tax=uncultured Cohaesibacter sp. TaxID=1002546 RepID=UPI0029C658D7|nr:DUF2125 domain-containing protein [uncultured Cohaesibacter sp.]
MKTDTDGTKSHRKYLYLIGALLVVFAGWSAFWYTSYTRAQEIVDKLLAREVNGTRLVSCADQSLGGYPFRLYLSCSAYEVNDPRSGWQAKGGPVRALWQVYAPNLAVIEAENRVDLTHDRTGETFTMVSELIRGSVRFSPTDFVKRASFEAEKPVVSSNNQQLARLLDDVSAEKIALHLRPNPETATDLDLSLSATDLSAGQLPLFSGQVSFTAVDGLSPAIRNEANPAKAWLRQSGKIEKIDSQIEVGQKTLKLAGDVAIDDSGLANGLLKLRILNPPASSATASATLTAKRDGLNGPLTAMQLMGKPVKDGDLIGSEVDVRLDKGKIRTGFLTLGSIPAVQ